MDEFLANFIPELVEAAEAAVAAPRWRAAWRVDPMDVGDADFKKSYRLSKALATDLINGLDPLVATHSIDIKTKEGKSVECMMIDYQLSRLSSPVVDILYLIFNCTDLATRKDHYNDWLDHYYKVLDDSLFQYNLKSSFVYPRDKMDADLKRYGKFCLGLSLVLASVIFRESDEAFDLSDIQDQAALEANPGGMGMMKQGTLVRVARRVQDLVDSFIAYGYL